MSTAVVIPKITKGTWMKVEVDGKIQEYQASRDLYYVREGNYVQVEEEEFNEVRGKIVSRSVAGLFRGLVDNDRVFELENSLPSRHSDLKKRVTDFNHRMEIEKQKILNATAATAAAADNRRAINLQKQIQTDNEADYLVQNGYTTLIDTYTMTDTVGGEGGQFTDVTLPYSQLWRNPNTEQTYKTKFVHHNLAEKIEAYEKEKRLQEASMIPQITRVLRERSKQPNIMPYHLKDSVLAFVLKKGDIPPHHTIGGKRKSRRNRKGKKSRKRTSRKRTSRKRISRKRTSRKRT
jgi:uncharacterized protein YcbK (DUF882 family)